MSLVISGFKVKPSKNHHEEGRKQAVGGILSSEIHNTLLIFEIRRNWLSSESNLLLYLFTRRVKNLL
jgi:hypothetical protein